MLLPIILSTLLTILIALTIAATLRLLSILPPNRPKPAKRRRVRSFSVSGVASKYNGPTPQKGFTNSAYGHICIVLGSGGHTAEMLLMTQSIVLEKWKRRTWVVSSGDGFSAQRAGEVEEDLALHLQHGRAATEGIGESVITTIPRARKVHQPLWTAPISSLKCLWACLHLLTRWDAPDLILTNGPGTGVIVVLASLILRFCDFSGTGAGKTRVVYVESLARVRKLSLSGRLLAKVADRFLVQWKELEGVGEFVGAVTLDAVRNAGVVDAKAENKTDDTARIQARRIRFEI